MDNRISEFRDVDTVPQESRSDVKSDYLSGNANTKIPVDINFDSEASQIFSDPLPDSLPGKSHDVPGWMETFAGKFTEQEELIQIARDEKRRIQDNSPLDDNVDSNWSALDDKTALIGIDPRNANYILSATGPKDQRRRYNYVLDEQEHQERISNGSFVMQLLGGGTGAVFSPSSLLIVGKLMKYAKLSQTFMQTMPRMIPGIAVSSASHEAVIESTKTGGNLHDWAINTMVDIGMGTLFMGAGIGAHYVSDALKLWNARKILNMMNAGVEARPVLNEKGIVTGYKATPVDNSVGAAEVDMAQVYLDAAIAKNSIHYIPFIGDTVGKTLGKSASWITGFLSPKIRMMNSPFETIRGIANNYIEHSFETVGMQAGRPLETPFETFISMIKGTNTNLKTQYDGLYVKRNGIDYDPVKGPEPDKLTLQGKVGEYFKDGKVSRDDFGREVQHAIITEEQSEVSAVNDAALLLRENMDPMYLEYLKLEGISDRILKPKTTKGYLSRVYWAARMELNEDLWMEQVPQKLAEDDSIIATLMEPIFNARENLRIAQENHERFIRTSPSTEEIKLSSDNLDDLRLAVNARENELQNNLRENEDLHRHVEDLFSLSASEAEQIKSILKPIEKIERELNSQKRIVARLKEEQSRNKQASLKAKTSETATKRAKLKDEAKKNLIAEEQKLQELQDHLDTENELLQEKMHNKQIPEELYHRIPESNRYKLKDPANRLKLREQYESDIARTRAAKSYYDSILNQTAEDNIANIMGRISGTQKENPLVARTLPIDDKWLYDNKWLHPDPAINVMNYRSYLGRKIAMKKILNRLTVNGTLEELISRFSNEHASAKDKLLEPYNKLKSELDELNAQTGEDVTERISALENDLVRERKKYESKVKKLGNKYRKAKEDLELLVGQMTNKSRYSKKSREYSRIANLYAVVTKLGFLAATMSTDSMAIIFKHGFWPAIYDGLLPMLKNLGGLLNTAEGEAIRENAAHAYVSQRHVNMAYSDKNWTGTTQTYEAVQGKLVKGLETLAHYSQNFSLANYVENFNERWTAFTINSKIMKAMRDHQNGKLNDQTLKDCLRYGIDPKEWSERFLKGRNEKFRHGSGIGYYWEWADKEASNLMSQAIHRAVKDTIIRRGLLDAPFAMDNPIFSSIFLFKGYVLASMTRFLAPLLQRPDMQKIIGTALMMTAGATQNPLRRLAAGQDPVQEKDHMFRNAVRDGGVFSVFGDVYEEVNFLTHGLLQETVTNERYRGRTEMGVLNGPAGSIVNDMTRAIGALATGEMNKTDLKRIAVNVPFLYDWKFRYGVNKFIESRDLPKTRTQAHERNKV